MPTVFNQHNKHSMAQMEWKGLSQLFYENNMFENLMHGPTLCFDVEFTQEDKAILGNLMFKQEDAHIA